MHLYKILKKSPENQRKKDFISKSNYESIDVQYNFMSKKNNNEKKAQK